MRLTLKVLVSDLNIISLNNSFLMQNTYLLTKQNVHSKGT